MDSIHDLENQEGTVWELAPSRKMRYERVLLWLAARELASMLEVSYHPEQMREIAEEAVFVLGLANAHFKERNEPRPIELAHVMILIERADAGLDPRG